MLILDAKTQHFGHNTQRCVAFGGLGVAGLGWTHGLKIPDDSGKSRHEKWGMFQGEWGGATVRHHA